MRLHHRRHRCIQCLVHSKTPGDLMHVNAVPEGEVVSEIEGGMDDGTEADEQGGELDRGRPRDGEEVRRVTLASGKSWRRAVAAFGLPLRLSKFVSSLAGSSTLETETCASRACGPCLIALRVQLAWIRGITGLRTCLFLLCAASITPTPGRYTRHGGQLKPRVRGV